jgi:hypothetical protein
MRAGQERPAGEEDAGKKRREETKDPNWEGIREREKREEREEKGNKEGNSKKGNSKRTFHFCRGKHDDGVVAITMTLFDDQTIGGTLHLTFLFFWLLSVSLLFFVIRLGCRAVVGVGVGGIRHDR